MSQHRLFALVAALAAMTLAGCGGQKKQANPADAYAGLPGEPTVYAKIAALSDCDRLLAEFNAADQETKDFDAQSDEFRASLGYLNTAKNRMDELGCPY